MAWIRLTILMLLMLAVAGCGGDSVPLRSETAAQQAQMMGEADVDAEGSAVSTVVQDNAVIEEDALAEERQQVEEAIMEADTARGQADEKIATQEAQLRATTDFVPYVSTSGHAEFDGHDIRVYLPIYAGGYPVVLNSVLNEADGMAAASRVTGYSQHVWTLFDNGPLATVSVRWNDREGSDYLAGGWWVREAFGRNELEAGAFVDGPELRGPLPDSMSLPLRGQAVYYGEAAGLYQTQTRVHCTAFPCDIPSPDRLVGEFVADAKLVANFSRGDIEGCVGCQQGIRFTRAAYDLDSGDIERGGAVTEDYLFWLHRVGFLESPHTKGTFAGDLTVVPLGGHAAGYGYWQGRFSNLSDNAGSPRLLGATLHGQFEDESTATRFIGMLSAESATFGGGGR